MNFNRGALSIRFLALAWFGAACVDYGDPPQDPPTEVSATSANLGPGHCTDGIRDGDEERVDCGGSCGVCKKNALWMSRGVGGPDVRDDYNLALADPEAQTTWPETQGTVDVMMVSFSNVHPNNVCFPSASSDSRCVGELDHLATLLSDFPVIALNGPGALFLQCPDREHQYQRDIDALTTLKSMGIEVGYLSIQSVLSKRDTPAGCHVYDGPEGMTLRYQDVATYMTKLLDAGDFDHIVFGLIDALPTHGGDYQSAYRGLVDYLAARGLAIEYLHLDGPFHRPDRLISTSTIAEVQNHVRQEYDWDFGLTFTSNSGGHASSQQFYRDVRDYQLEVHSAGIVPDDAWVVSWFPYPTTATPEWSTSSTEIPFTRVVRDFASAIGRDAPQPSSPIGSVNPRTAGCHLTGWSCDLDNPGTPQAIHVRRQGQVVARGFANLLRESAVADRCQGIAAQGFRIPLPAELNGLVVHVASLDVDFYGDRTEGSGSANTRLTPPEGLRVDCQ